MCIVCNKKDLIQRNLICCKCWANIDFLSDNRDQTFLSVVRYNETVKKLIHIFKYKSPWMIKRIFINWMDLMYHELLKEMDVIIPVPMHSIKLMSRGYNQTAVLGSEISKTYNKLFIVDGLQKVRNTTSQSSLSQAERLVNLNGCFTINRSRIKDINNKKVLIIDDVLTTGSTLSECSRALGSIPLDIKCLTIARTDI